MLQSKQQLKNPVLREIDQPEFYTIDYVTVGLYNMSIHQRIVPKGEPGRDRLQRSDCCQSNWG